MFSQLAYVKVELGKVGHAGWPDVSKGSGVPLSTIKKIGYGDTKYSRADTIDKIATYFKTRERRTKKSS